jgi:signal transduction histidine kinase
MATALLLISELALLGIDPEASRYDRMTTTLGRLAVEENRVRQDILAARAGLLRTYDPINQQMDALHDSLGQLRREGVDGAVLRPLEEPVEQQDDLVEHFKTDNALLRNSLAYFGLLSGRFGDAIQDGPLASAMTALAASVLNLTLDTSAVSIERVEHGLNRFAAQAPSNVDMEMVSGILAHGRLLRNLLPATDHVLISLYGLELNQRLEAVRASVLARQTASRARATRYRLLLYATSMLLLVWLVCLGWQLRRHMLALRRHAAFEHTIAAISMGFLNARADDIGRHVESALATLADWVEADRAYFVVSTEAPRLFCWSRDGGGWPPGWPRHAPALAACGTGTEGLTYIPSVDSLPEGAGKAALKSAGLSGWVCVLANGHDGNHGALGFDAVRKPLIWPRSECGLLRTAVDTIANAVRHVVLESDRARLESSLQQARRMETIGAMASGVAHNFNNIIGAILGYTEMEESYAVADRRLARSLQGIRHASERGQDLIDQILTFGRRKDLPHRTVTLQSLMTETRLLLSASLPPQAHLAVGPIPRDAVVSGDPVQLQQVIINLCNNAMQATDGPSTIEVATEIYTITEHQQFSHGYLVPGRYVRIAVRDTGRGMDAAALERLFEPFFTTRLNGNGLGLATVREIVRSHRGAINVSSRPGSGSLFEVWLAQVARPSTTSAQTASLQGKGETVLVIDDDRARLLRDEEIVAALGYEPVGFAEPDQALRACRTTPQRFDALLIGRLMPMARALALSSELHKVIPGIPILIAGSVDEPGADVLASAGVSEVISMPLISTELAAALSRWVPG